MAIMGRADQGPFGLLGLLRDPQMFMMDLLEQPEEDIFAGLDVCVAAGVAFAKAQLAAGADLTSIGDGLAGESLISPAMYRRFSQPFERRYKEQLGGGLLSLHICGRSDNIIEGMVAAGAEVLELDHLNDMDRSFGIVAGRCCVFGNIDPSRSSIPAPPASSGKNAARPWNPPNDTRRDSSCARAVWSWPPLRRKTSRR